jgi:hypothetical protein
MTCALGSLSWSLIILSPTTMRHDEVGHETSSGVAMAALSGAA